MYRYIYIYINIYEVRGVDKHVGNWARAHLKSCESCDVQRGWPNWVVMSSGWRGGRFASTFTLEKRRNDDARCRWNGLCFILAGACKDSSFVVVITVAVVVVR